MPGLLTSASRVALDLLFPPQCAVCGRDGILLCASCEAALPRAAGLRCDVCWMPVRAPGACAHCAEAPPAFASLRSACVLEGGARRLAHQLKYDGMTALAEPMARILAEHAPLDDVDLIVPVPLHGGRERARGYNQAAEIARHLGRIAGLPVHRRAARRTRATAPLVKAMSRDERRAIVAGAFAAQRSGVEGRRVLLIDDVVTTGATLDACAQPIVEAGAASVRCLTWARAD